MQPPFTKIKRRGALGVLGNKMKYFNERGWGHGVSRGLMGLGKREYATGFPQLIHPGAKKVVGAHRGISWSLSIPLSDITLGHFIWWLAF